MDLEPVDATNLLGDGSQEGRRRLTETDSWIDKIPTSFGSEGITGSIEAKSRLDSFFLLKGVEKNRPLDDASDDDKYS